MQTETRRLPGRNLFFPTTGAVAEVTTEEIEAAGPIPLVRAVARARMFAENIGWQGPSLIVREHKKGASVAISSPVDLTRTACLLLELALSNTPAVEAVGQLKADVEKEQNLQLRKLVREAREVDLPWMADEDGFTAGLGKNGQTWALDALPDSIEEMKQLASIPLAFVTGTNGKTTTTRLITRIAELAGKRAGLTSSDGIRIGDRWIERGDWSGPGAARLLLREPELDVATIECARGGMLRRGLAVDGADVAVITNITLDHLGEWGIDSIEAMADVKCLVVGAVKNGGQVVVNSDNADLWEPLLRALRVRRDIGIRQFTAGPKGLGPNGWPHDAWVDEAGIMQVNGVGPIVAVDEIPITLGGKARHNVENAIGAALAALAMGFSVAEIAAGLKSFQTNAADSRGRVNTFTYKGATVILDFAHNPDGVKRVVELAKALPAKRKLMTLGQCGDRPDDIVQTTARNAAALGADHYIVKDLPTLLRGRSPGEVPTILRATLEAEGIAADKISGAVGDVEGANRALAWGEEGDLLVVLVHEDFDAAVAALLAGGAVPAPLPRSLTHPDPVVPPVEG
jgi:cyanophycin synthetase